MPAGNTRNLSIIVPTLNEEGNVEKLVRRIDRAMADGCIEYEIIFIDDHSIDDTVKIISKLAENFPILYFLKKGRQGKAFSIIEGLSQVRHDYVAFIDADLQYPPEAFPAMLAKVENGCDICVANRKYKKESWVRNLISKVLFLVFERFLHRFNCDVQAGQKVFKREVAETVKVNPSPWTVDLEFLIKARNYGYKICSFDITFAKREVGASKLPIIKGIFEIGLNNLKLKFKKIPALLINFENSGSMIGAGIADRGRRFITHTTLPIESSASYTFSFWQKLALFIFIPALGWTLFSRPFTTGTVLVGFLSIIYFFDMLFYFFIIMRSLKSSPEINSTPEEIARLKDEELPVYTILCPLYRESEVLNIFLENIKKLEWPKEKLDVLLLLEEKDWTTIQAANSLSLPDYVRTIIVPDSLPKTKPKACNYGLNLARGKFIVIYDAEDAPDPWQLKKAYLGFKKSPESVRCLQAKLNYYNPHQNILTKLFTAEYSLWFEVALPGLQSINTALPLGGTSNHFYTKDLLKLKGWDPFNVTEDCELGVRIFKAGFRTAIINSVTLEEANSSLKNWLRQRSRWIKGYMQTYLVNMRRPIEFFKKFGFHSFVFQMVVGAKISFLFINPILWLATISYFTWRGIVGPSIEALYPPAILYLAVTSLIIGNFLYLYYYMIGCAKREQWDLVKYVFLVPFYWLIMSIASLVSLYQLIVKPYFWEKTRHGLHLKKPVVSAVPELDFLTGFRRFAFFDKIMSNFRSSKIASQAGIFVAAVMFSNVLNFIYSFWIGRILNFEDLGLTIFVNAIWYIVMIFVTSFGTTINHYSAIFNGAGESESSSGFRRSIILKGLRVILPFTFLWLLAAPVLSVFFNVSDYLILLLISPIFPLGLLIYANIGYLQGILRFRSAALIMLMEAVFKLAYTGILVSLGRKEWAFSAIPAAVVAVAIFSIILTKRYKVADFKPQKFAFPFKFLISSLMTSLSAISFLSFDIILARHFLSPLAAGQYSLLSLVGKMVYFGGSLPNFFTMTFVSRNEGMHRETAYILKRIFTATLILLAGSVVLLGFFGDITARIFFGEKTAAIVPYLPLYTAAIAFFTLTNVIVYYHLALKNYNYSIISFSVSLLMMGGIVFWHDSISQFVNIIFISGVLSFAVISAWHLINEWKEIIKRNLKDLLEIFTGKISIGKQAALGQKRILIFNWRDMRHAYAGGAEIYIQKISEYWAGQGNEVTIFCGNDGFSARNETINGVNIIRRGGFYLVYVWAFMYYMIYFRGRFDLIIDCQNGVPFFTPIYAKEPVYCLMHHVHQEVFRRSLIKPLALVAIFLEKAVMPVVYRHIKFITVSESSRKDIAGLGLGLAGISVVNPGVDLVFHQPGRKSPFPLVLYFGRLKQYKSIDVLIKAFKQIIAKMPAAKLVIVGSGEECEKLKTLAFDLNLEKEVIFTGHVTDEEKRSWLQKAWVAVNPSFMEGWGITTIEANACGTPVVASRVPGLQDSIQNPHTGLLVEYGNVTAFAIQISKILNDYVLRERLSTNATKWAKNFDWESRSRIFLECIDKDYHAKRFENII